mgnify:CR=1 FL=1
MKFSILNCFTGTGTAKKGKNTKNTGGEKTLGAQGGKRTETGGKRNTGSDYIEFLLTTCERFMPDYWAYLDRDAIAHGRPDILCGFVASLYFVSNSLLA